MDPNFWGPGQWKFLHATAAVAYGEQERLDFEQYVMALARVLPCGKCKEHFRANLRENPIRNYMSNNETLFLWTYIMHKAVTDAQGKPGITFEEAYKMYFDVGDDTDADFVGEYQNSICQDVCSETAAQARGTSTLPVSNNGRSTNVQQSNNKSTSNFSGGNRKFKTRK